MKKEDMIVAGAVVGGAALLLLSMRGSASPPEDTKGVLVLVLRNGDGSIAVGCEASVERPIMQNGQMTGHIVIGTGRADHTGLITFTVPPADDYVIFAGGHQIQFVSIQAGQRKEVPVQVLQGHCDVPWIV